MVGDESPTEEGKDQFPPRLVESILRRNNLRK